MAKMMLNSDQAQWVLKVSQEISKIGLSLAVEGGGLIAAVLLELLPESGKLLARRLTVERKTLLFEGEKHSSLSLVKEVVETESEPDLVPLAEAPFDLHLSQIIAHLV